MISSKPPNKPMKQTARAFLKEGRCVRQTQALGRAEARLAFSLVAMHFPEPGIFRFPSLHRTSGCRLPPNKGLQLQPVEP